MLAAATASDVIESELLCLPGPKPGGWGSARGYGATGSSRNHVQRGGVIPGAGLSRESVLSAPAMMATGDQTQKLAGTEPKDR